MKTTEYEQQANNFLKKTGAKIKIQFSHNGKHFFNDTTNRDIYKITISKGRRSYTFNFGQSLAKSGIVPTNYEILSCLQKYDIGSFEDFCGEFGYDTDSRNAERTYNAVCREYESLCRLFSEEEMELMAEIQ